MTLREEVKELILKEIEEEDLTIEDVRSWLIPEHGSVGSLFYYDQTESFAVRHYNEIIEIMKDMECGPMSLNDMAWLGFLHHRDEIIDEIYES